jgi:hypothetical protein
LKAPREESKKKKGAAAGTGKEKPPGPTQQMEADEEGTADDVNFSRKKPPKPTQQMKKTLSAQRSK